MGFLKHGYLESMPVGPTETHIKSEPPPHHHHLAGPLRTSFLADEGPLRSLWNALPHGDGLGVARVRGPPLLAVAPVPLAFEKVGLAHRFPAQSRVDAFSGQTAAQLPKAVGVPRLHRHFLKHPVLVTCGQEEPRVSLLQTLNTRGCG